MSDERPFHVGVVAWPHPHTLLHRKTLEALPEVAALHLRVLAREDGAALAAAAPETRSVTADLTALLARSEGGPAARLRAH